MISTSLAFSLVEISLMYHLTWDIMPTWLSLNCIPREHVLLESEGVFVMTPSKANETSLAVPKYTPESRSSVSVTMLNCSFE